MQAHVRLGALALALALLATLFAGCSAVNNNPEIGKVGDIPINYYTYANALETLKEYYDYGVLELEVADASNPMPELREEAFDQVVDALLPVAVAKMRGVELTDADMADFQARVDSQLESEISTAAAEIGVGEDRDAAYNYFLTTLKNNGYTIDEYTALIEESVRQEMISEKMRAEAEAGAVASEGIMKMWYEETIKLEKETFTNDLASYYSASQYYSYITGVPPVYMPAGFSLLKHIFIANPTEGEEKDVNAIVAEIQAKLDAGEDFDALLEEYNEDEEMGKERTSEDGRTGRMFAEAVRAEFETAYAEAALALEEGEVSGPVTTGDGVYFIKNLGELDEKITPYEEIEEPLRAYTLQTAKDELYEAALEAWRSEVEIVKDMKRIESIDMTLQANH